MRIVTGEQMAAIDRKAIEEIGIPAAALMENAGYQVALAAWELLPHPRTGRRVVVVAGRGNNGADGCVAARYLANWGARVRVYRIADSARRKGGRGPEEELASGPEGARGDVTAPSRSLPPDLATLQSSILTRIGIDVTPVTPADLSKVRLNLAMADLVVDGLLGTGFRGEPEGLVAALIEAVNEAKVPVVAVDVPSGVDAGTGAATKAVYADVTVTFGLPKLGTLLFPGASHCGRLKVVDIGFPKPLLEENADLWWLQPQQVREWLPPRPADSYKGTYGHVLIVAGSRGMTGAGQLAVRGCHRAGAGLVTWGLPGSLQLALAPEVPEALTVGLGEGEAGHLGPEAVDQVLQLAAERDCVVLGPGLGRSPGAVSFVTRLLERLDKPVVIDADAINALAAVSSSAVKGAAKAEWILTPHPGEMARLLGTPAATIQRDPVGAAREAARRFQAVAVLKGARTVIAAPDGRAWLNSTGNPALATGGTGDVLAGAIGALRAQGLPGWQAAAVGVFLHGLAGELAGEGKGGAGVLAREIADHLPLARWRVAQG